MIRSHYTFGDNSLAARRLNLLASTFDPSSRLLLNQLRLGVVHTALDVGCGPGHTTRLVSQMTGARRTVGFDQSRVFLELARENYGSDPSLEFQCCSVLDSPLPLPSAQLVFSRFLLTHLAEPVRALRNLVECIEVGGHLVLEEIERLDSPLPLLRRYYELVAALQSNHGQSTTIGAQLDDHVASLKTGIETLSSECTPLQLMGTQMPQLHLMNIATWKQDPKVEAIASAEELDRIERELSALIAAGSAPVECTLRQIVLVKTGE
jgi:trans-aconitate 2-methyltransferase